MHDQVECVTIVHANNSIFCFFFIIYIQDAPSPGSYNVQEAYEQMYGQGQHGEPRSKAAQKRQSSFLSTAPRNSFFQYNCYVPGGDQILYAPRSDLVMNILVFFL